MSKVDITQVIVSEQERLLKRKAEIETKVDEANVRVQTINQQKIMIMDHAQKIMSEGEIISLQSHKIKILTDEMNMMQKDVLKWTEDLKSDPNVALFN